MNENKDENSYNTILKRISAFGGVQVFNILVNILRGKFVAIFLGPHGMGVANLFTSSTNTIQQMASLGLNLALVKEVASGKENDRLPTVMTVALRLILLTSILGAVLCFLLAPWLSLWTFDTYDYTLSFMVLSASVALSVGGAGYLSLLQGLGEVKRLSRASMVGGLTGLICGVPLYWLFGEKGIVPAIFLLSLAMFVFYYFSLEKSVNIDKVRFKWDSHKPLVKKLVTLGLVLMASSLATTLINYLINIFIRATGSESEVGLFQAANSLTNQYVGVVFSALALDYFPRLSAICGDSAKLKEVVNRQLEIVILVMTPLVITLIATTPVVIRLLLTSDFLVITPLMRWMGLGVLLQAIEFPLGYIFIAKENKRIFIWLQIVFSNILWIACSIGGYYLFSLVGLGISLVVRTAIDTTVNYIICHRKYAFTFSRRVSLVMSVCIVLGCLGFMLSFLPEPYQLCLLPPLVIFSALMSFMVLRKALKQKHTE